MVSALNNQSGLMPLAHALQNMRAQSPVCKDSEQLSTLHAIGRVLSKPIYSAMNVPPHDNSAMDGFAFHAAQTLETGTSFSLCGASLAGHPFTGAVPDGGCIRITTGAILPTGTNTVMMQENVTVSDDKVTLNQEVEPGNSVRRAGEDIGKDEKIIDAGKKLTAADLALLASVGIASIDVIRKLKVAIIATGDELIEPGNSLESGQIYESNRFALQGLLSQHCVDITHYGIIEDDLDKTKQALQQASETADVVLTCGGVSVGDADLVKQVLDVIGQINFWKVAIKPGKPFAFGSIGKAIFCGLPGNPVSSYVTFEKLVVPLLNHIQGIQAKQQITLMAKCATPIYKRPGRADFQRGIVYQDEQQALWVKPNGKQGSGVMTSIANANCYILLDQDQGNLAAGSNVKIQLF